LQIYLEKLRNRQKQTIMNVNKNKPPNKDPNKDHGWTLTFQKVINQFLLSYVIPAMLLTSIASYPTYNSQKFGI